MPVIGRLDQQVDDVLIKPASGRRDREDAPGPQKFPKAPPETGAGDEAGEAPPKREPSDLPVWLL